jgi:hypothetical protein
MSIVLFISSIKVFCHSVRQRARFSLDGTRAAWLVLNIQNWARFSLDGARGGAEQPEFRTFVRRNCCGIVRVRSHLFILV